MRVRVTENAYIFTHFTCIGLSAQSPRPPLPAAATPSVLGFGGVLGRCMCSAVAIAVLHGKWVSGKRTIHINEATRPSNFTCALGRGAALRGATQLTDLAHTMGPAHVHSDNIY